MIVATALSNHANDKREVEPILVTFRCCDVSGRNEFRRTAPRLNQFMPYFCAEEIHEGHDDDDECHNGARFVVLQ